MIAWHHKVTEGSDNLFWHFQHFLVNGSQFQIRSFCDYFTHKDTIISASRNTPIDVTNLYISYQVWLDKMEDHSNLLHNIATLSTDDQQLGKKKTASQIRFTHVSLHGLLAFATSEQSTKLSAGASCLGVSETSIERWWKYETFVFLSFSSFFLWFLLLSLMKNLRTYQHDIPLCIFVWFHEGLLQHVATVMIPWYRFSVNCWSFKMYTI